MDDEVWVVRKVCLTNRAAGAADHAGRDRTRKGACAHSTVGGRHHPQRTLRKQLPLGILMKLGRRESHPPQERRALNGKETMSATVVLTAACSVDLGKQVSMTAWTAVSKHSTGRTPVHRTEHTLRRRRTMNHDADGAT